jgi:GMP synthase (glutamine-hydrolysing)
VSVLVLDFGSQYTRLIVRRLRELHALSVVLPGTADIERVRAARPAALVLSGSPFSTCAPDAPRPDERIYDMGLPMLGICYGFHLLTLHFGGRVARTTTHEYGRTTLSRVSEGLFAGVERGSQVWMSHADSVDVLPAGWRVTAASPENPIAAAESTDGRRVGLQFHPEVSHTPIGAELLERFLDRAGVARDWTPGAMLDRLTSETTDRVGTERVLLGLSGGVDSSTLALLLARAGILHLGVFVDHGLLRAGERETVAEALREAGVALEVVDARERFLEALDGVADPEEKRRIIGREFIAVFEEVARAQGPFRFLAQGTLYPDVIESAGSEGAANIKSHHNVGGLPERLGFELVEPFRLLFKDEVRELARRLDLPAAIRDRHPFPGPGLGIRVLGTVTAEKVDLARRADRIFVDALRSSGWYDRVWQALAVLIPVRSVGVAGDERRYGYVAALRAVTSVDGMTADWARLPHDLLDEVSARITREVPEIGRVVYDTTSKPPATIEWE